MVTAVLDPVTSYATEVVAGRIVAGRLVRLACQRHLNDLLHGSERGLTFDRKAADYAISFFEEVLVLTDGAFAGKPFILQRFQKFIVGSLFGWMRDYGQCGCGGWMELNTQGMISCGACFLPGADPQEPVALGAFRRFRTAYIETGKGSGKSPLAAGIGLLGLTEDGEAAAEIYAAAVTRDQAKILFADAEKMGQGSRDLSKELEFTVNNIAHPASHSFFRAISAEARALDGKRVHMALIDEVHEHPNAMVVDKMRAGTKNRRQALIFEITNSGYDRNSVCYQHHVYSQQILEGIVENDDWFGYVCQLDSCGAEGHHNPVPGCPDCDDWTDEAVWPKVQPGLDTIMPRKYMREQVAEALGMPSKLNIVLRLNFCVWTEQANRWLDMNAWDGCAQQVNPLSLKGRPCWMGIDLSYANDLSAAALVFEPDADDVIDVVMYYWLPEEGLRLRVARDRVPYDVWTREGFIEVTEGNVVDFQAIRKRIDEMRDEGFNIRQIALDPWNAIESARILEEDMGFSVESITQGYKTLTAPSKELERRIMSRKVRHGGNPVLRWNAANVSIAMDPAGNIKPDKEKSTERIDGISALVNAFVPMLLDGGSETDAGYFSVRGAPLAVAGR